MKNFCLSSITALVVILIAAYAPRASQPANAELLAGKGYKEKARLVRRSFGEIIEAKHNSASNHETPSIYGGVWVASVL